MIPTRSFLSRSLIFAALLCRLATAVPLQSAPLAARSSDTVSALASDYTATPGVSHNLGHLSPFFAATSNVSAALPATCNVTLVSALHRHGARYPTSSALYDVTAAKLRVDALFALPAPYRFLKDWRYELGGDRAGTLTPFGQQELAASGRAFYERYAHLADGGGGGGTPFLRAADSARVVMSAHNFSAGFAAAAGGGRAPAAVLVVQHGNSTLAASQCTAFTLATAKNALVGTAQQKAWRDAFAPNITRRLNADLPGLGLADADAVRMMDLCSYATVAAANVAALSPFCALFAPPDWAAYEYLQDLAKWYGFGPGARLGPSQGVGWAAELVARLTGAPVRAVGAVNATAAARADTFPRDRSLYVDFSHDNDMVGIMSALGLFNATVAAGGLPPTHCDAHRAFRASETVPFASRMYVEKVRCGGDEKVRFVVNDRVWPLTTCAADEWGMCALDEWVAGLDFVRMGGLWGEC